MDFYRYARCIFPYSRLVSWFHLKWPENKILYIYFISGSPCNEIKLICFQIIIPWIEKISWYEHPTFLPSVFSAGGHFISGKKLRYKTRMKYHHILFWSLSLDALSPSKLIKCLFADCGQDEEENPNANLVSGSYFHSLNCIRQSIFAKKKWK